MKRKELQSLLQDVETFRNPKQELEQYLTGPEIAASVVHQINEDFEDLSESIVCDLGCGTGMLGIACAFMDSPYVLGIDIDSEALSQATANAESYPGLPIHFIQADVCRLGVDCLELMNASGNCIGEQSPTGATFPFNQSPIADIVITNPPFGSWRSGADCAFLAAAVKLSKSSVYSMHKRSTREHIKRFVTQTLGKVAAVIAELRYDLPASYKHHRQKSKDIEVDVWRIEV